MSEEQRPQQPFEYDPEEQPQAIVGSGTLRGRKPGIAQPPESPPAGIIEVGFDESGNVLLNLPALQLDENGVGHIVCSTDQARNFAYVLLTKAAEADAAIISDPIVKGTG